MFLQPMGETGYELRFSVLGIPVMVHPFFWLMPLLFFGQMAVSQQDGIPIVNLVAAVAAVFFSLMVHELGHSIAMAFYGIRSRIVLYAMGGMAIPMNAAVGFSRRGMWDQVVISFAGPLAQFLLLGLLLVVWFFVPIPPTPVVSLSMVLVVLVFCNLVWPVFNLMPILPMDGGHICQGIARMVQGRYQGDITALWISVIAGVVLVVLAFQYGLFFAGIFLAMMTLQNFQELQQGGRRW